MLDNLELVRKFIQETPPEEVHPPRLINGKDLQGMGFRPGPIFKEILAAVEEAQLEGKLQSHEDALSFVEDQFSRARES